MKCFSEAQFTGLLSGFSSCPGFVSDSLRHRQALMLAYFRRWYLPAPLTMENQAMMLRPRNIQGQCHEFQHADLAWAILF